jgi:glycosyltransferase involved in cell wall biosynthesis
MKYIAFSVLIPAIFERLEDLQKLSAELQRQITAAGRTDVEVVSVVDNCSVSIGYKRNAVLRASHGKFVAFVDDDDWVSPDYIQQIMTAIDAHGDVDVITFNNHSFIDSDTAAEVIMELGNPNQPYNPKRFLRAAWHTCAWRSDIAKTFNFPDSSYGEDWAWAEKCNKSASTTYHIDAFLHIYRFSTAKTRAKA